MVTTLTNTNVQDVRDSIQKLQVGAIVPPASTTATTSHIDDAVLLTPSTTPVDGAAGVFSLSHSHDNCLAQVQYGRPPIDQCGIDVCTGSVVTTNPLQDYLVDEQAGLAEDEVTTRDLDWKVLSQLLTTLGGPHQSPSMPSAPDPPPSSPICGGNAGEDTDNGLPTIEELHRLLSGTLSNQLDRPEHDVLAPQNSPNISSAHRPEILAQSTGLGRDADSRMRRNSNISSIVGTSDANSKYSCDGKKNFRAHATTTGPDNGGGDGGSSSSNSNNNNNNNNSNSSALLGMYGLLFSDMHSLEQYLHTLSVSQLCDIERLVQQIRASKKDRAPGCEDSPGHRTNRHSPQVRMDLPAAETGLDGVPEDMGGFHHTHSDELDPDLSSILAVLAESTSATHVDGDFATIAPFSPAGGAPGQHSAPLEGPSSATPLNAMDEPKESANDPTIQTDEDNVPWLTFTYAQRGRPQRHTIRVDLDRAALPLIPMIFKRNNCVYPRAHCSKEEYAGNRWAYESECNRLGWQLAFLNQELMVGKRGLLQRAVDSYRHVKSGRKARRPRRAKMTEKTGSKSEVKNKASDPERDQQFPGTNSATEESGSAATTTILSLPQAGTDVLLALIQDSSIAPSILNNHQSVDAPPQSQPISPQKRDFQAASITMDICEGNGTIAKRHKLDTLQQSAADSTTTAASSTMPYLVSVQPIGSAATSDATPELLHPPWILPKPQSSVTTSPGGQQGAKLINVDAFINGHTARMRIRIDFASVPDDIPEAFRQQHSVFPRVTGAPKDRYKNAPGRWEFEMVCNDISWRLAWLNRQRLAGKTPLIQQCLDSLRGRTSTPPQESLARLPPMDDHAKNQLYGMWVLRPGKARRQHLLKGSLLTPKLGPKRTTASTDSTPKTSMQDTHSLKSPSTVVATAAPSRENLGSQNQAQQPQNTAQGETQSPKPSQPSKNAVTSTTSSTLTATVPVRVVDAKLGSISSPLSRANQQATAVGKQRPRQSLVVPGKSIATNVSNTKPTPPRVAPLLQKDTAPLVPRQKQQQQQQQQVTPQARPPPQVVGILTKNTGSPRPATTPPSRPSTVQKPQPRPRVSMPQKPTQHIAKAAASQKPAQYQPRPFVQAKPTTMPVKRPQPLQGQPVPHVNPATSSGAQPQRPILPKFAPLQAKSSSSQGAAVTTSSPVTSGDRVNSGSVPDKMRAPAPPNAALNTRESIKTEKAKAAASVLTDVLQQLAKMGSTKGSTSSKPPSTVATASPPSRGDYCSATDTPADNSESQRSALHDKVAELEALLQDLHSKPNSS